jgi:phospholipid/cholesterol/gamma-HCH transport system permease protein
MSIALSGDWTSASATLEARRQVGGSSNAVLEDLAQRLEGAQPPTIEYDTSRLLAWDSKLLVLIRLIDELAQDRGAVVDHDGLPEGLERLRRLSRAVPPREGLREPVKAKDALELAGRAALDTLSSFGDLTQFLGESLLSLGRFIRGKARYQRSDILILIQEAGVQALPIVAIINLLLGVIMAFMGAVQLQQFGAEIFVANLVGLGVTREIAPMMTAIVMAGRTGAAYAAQLGSMQVNEEIDALETFGFSAIDFLVLPRMIALAVMMPILVIYADAIGVFGGYLVGVGLLDLGTAEYIHQTRSAVSLGDVALGVLKGSVFGVLVAVTGCMQGLRSGRSASAVGDAATAAVVLGIISIIVTTAIFAVLSNSLGI